MRILRRCLVWSFALAAVLAAPTYAQSDSLIQRLPPDTLLYFRWDGTATLGSVSQTNPLLRLWSDPQFRSLRQTLAEDFYSGARRNPTAANLTPEELSQLFSLFENPVVVGLIGGGGSGPDGAKTKMGTFLIFETKGKLELLQKLYARMSGAGTVPAPAASYAIGPNTVDKIVEKKQTYFQAIVGDYYIRSENLETILELVPRFRPGETPATSLAQWPAYQETRSQVPAGVLAEFFLRIPDLSKLNLPLKKDFNFVAFARALHLERLHAVTASLSLTAEATHVHSSIVGETSAGGLFDLFGESQQSFATLPLAPAGVSYSSTRINLAAFYQLLRHALLAAVPPEQAAKVSSLDTMGSMTLGMPLSEALQLFTGEFGYWNVNPADESAKPAFAATIQDPEKVLDLLRHVLASMLSTEDREGTTTFLELAMPYTDPKSGAHRRRFYTVCVTSNLLLVGPRKAMLRDALARSVGKPTEDSAGRLADDATFSTARAALPARLSGLGFMDLTRMDWNKLLAKIIQEAEESATKSGKPLDPSTEALKKLDVNSLKRYLHIFIDGSWKDSNGVYFDLYLQ